MCSFQDRSSLSVTPKYLNVLACSRGLSLILIEIVFKDFRRRVLPLAVSSKRVQRFEGKLNICKGKQSSVPERAGVTSFLGEKPPSLR